MSFSHLREFLEFCGLGQLFPSLKNQDLIELFCCFKDSILMNFPSQNINDKKLFDQLNQAIFKRQKIKFFYHQKARSVNGYKLLNHLGVWYLVGVEEGEIKSFALEKIKSLIIKKEEFEPNQDAMLKINQNQINFLSLKSFEVLLKVDSCVMEYFLSRKILQNQKIVSQNQENLVISTQVSYEEEILRLVQQWIPHIQILSPQFMIEKLTNRIQDYLHRLIF